MNYGRKIFEDREKNYHRRNNSEKRREMLESTALMLCIDLLEDVDYYQVLTRIAATTQGEI